MKNILILLLVAFALSANAQRPYQIESQLKLGTVNAGTASDSVLVRGADKIVKFIPRSEFGGGSETNPTLQAASDAGNVVVTNLFAVVRESTNNYEMAITPATINIHNEPRLSNFIFDGLNNKVIASNNSGGYTSLNFPVNESINSTYWLPENTSGTYTIATLNDIPYELNKVMLEGNNTVVGKNIRLNSLDGTTGNQIQAEQINMFNNAGYNNYMTPNGYDVGYNNGSSQVSTFMHPNQFGFVNNDYASYLRSPILTQNLIYTLPNHSGTLAIESSITTTFTTNDGKTITVTKGVITNIE